MNEIQIVETPIGEESVSQVCEAAVTAFPGYKVAKVEQAEGNWQLRLERVAEFPLKPLAPSDEESGEPAEDEPAAEEAAEEKSEPKGKPKKEKKAPKDDSAEDGIPEPDADDEAPAFGGGDHHHEEADPIARVEKLLRDLQKVVPQLQNLLKGDSLERDLPAPHLDANPGPHFDSPHAPPPHRPSMPPSIPSGPGMGGPGGPGLGMGGPGGRPGMSGPPRDRMPTFTKKRQAMRLTREANVSEQIARTELSKAYPDYDIELSLEGSEYIAKLTLKS